MLFTDHAGYTESERALLRLGDAASTTHLRLSALLDLIHDDLSMAQSARAVLRYLQAEGPLTVPQLAARRATSRQFVQKLVDGLKADGLVETRTNPEHKRSLLIALSPAGERRIADMANLEKRFLAEALSRSGVGENDVLVAAKTLETLIAVLDDWLAKPEGAVGGVAP